MEAAILTMPSHVRDVVLSIRTSSAAVARYRGLRRRRTVGALGVFGDAVTVETLGASAGAGRRTITTVWSSTGVDFPANEDTA